MDSRRFDALIQAIHIRLSRRTTVAAFAGAVLGAFSALPGKEIYGRRRRRRRRCNPACTPCQRCNRRRGRCQNLSNGTSCGECQACQAGQCVAAANGTTCAECLVCDNGACTQVAPDGSSCRGNGQCGSGRCFEPPNCAVAGSSPCDFITGAPCCSGGCSPIFPSLETICNLSLAGDPCHTNADCAPGLSCRVFLCG
jgi:hypothetical protein